MGEHLETRDQEWLRNGSPGMWGDPRAGMLGRQWRPCPQGIVWQDEGCGL